MHNRVAWARLFVPMLWMLGIYILSSVPDHGAPENAMESALQWVTPQLQNLLHIPVFGALCLCWFWALEGFASAFNKRAMLAFLLTLGFGCFDEWHQLSVPGRFGSVTDIMLNGLGALLVVVVLKRQDVVIGHGQPVQTTDK